MNINRDNYSEFIKDDRELQFVLALEEDSQVNLILHSLENHLQMNKVSGNVENFTIDGNRLEIETSRYNIFLLVLHNGDVCQYTINKRTKKPANYSRRMSYFSAIETLNDFIN